MSSDERTRAGGRDARDVDDWLRQGLEPERDTVDRVVRRSLAAGAATRPGRWLGFGVAGAATIALALAVAIFLPRGEPRESAAETVLGEGPVRILTITNLSGEVEVRYPAEGPGDGAVAPERLTRDPNRLTIYNSDGIVAAFAPAPAPHHFLMGGKS
jgi:hypothetical protein